MLSLFKRHSPPQANSITTHSPSNGVYCELGDLMALRWQAKTFALPKARQISQALSGSHRSNFRGRGMEFSEVRTYQAGDDVRSIDWRVTARRQKPHTKLFNEERERPVLLVCDQSTSMFFGSTTAFKSVKAAQASALIAWAALNHNDRVGGIVFSEHGHAEVKPTRSRKTTMRLLHHICSFNQALSAETNPPEESFTLTKALNEVQRTARPGTLIVIISDFIKGTSGLDKVVNQLAQHNDLVFVRCVDPMETSLPQPGNYPISEGNESIIMNTADKNARARFKAWAESLEADIKAMAMRARAPLIHLSTEQDCSKTLQSLLVSLS